MNDDLLNRSLETKTNDRMSELQEQMKKTWKKHYGDEDTLDRRRRKPIDDETYRRNVDKAWKSREAVRSLVKTIKQKRKSKRNGFESKLKKEHFKRAFTGYGEQRERGGSTEPVSSADGGVSKVAALLILGTAALCATTSGSYFELQYWPRRLVFLLVLCLQWFVLTRTNRSNRLYTATILPSIGLWFFGLSVSTTQIDQLTYTISLMNSIIFLLPSIVLSIIFFYIIEPYI